MYRLLMILISMILAGCFGNKATSEELTENDVYEIINLHIAEKLSSKTDSQTYWAIPVIKGPKIDSSYYQEFLAPSFSPFHYLTKENWDTTKIKGVSFVTGKEYEYFFDKNRTPKIDEEWEKKYNGQYLHCVSYPKLIPETNIIVIKHILTRPYVYCGTGLNNQFFYIKTDNGWKEK